MTYGVVRRGADRRGADRLQRPPAGHVEDVEPHRRRGDGARDLVGPPGPRAATGPAPLPCVPEVGDVPPVTRPARRVDREHVVPRAGGRPHLVVVEQVLVDVDGQGLAWPNGGTPPMGKPVAARTRRRRRAGRRRRPRPPPAGPRRAGWRRSPAPSPGSPSSVNTSDFTIWPTSTPMAAAASSAVRVPSGNVRTRAKPEAAPAASTRVGVGVHLCIIAGARLAPCVTGSSAVRSS